ncbi:MAG: hypothetical protein AAFQ78_00140 [Bacteroidota bacterium]
MQKKDQEALLQAKAEQIGRCMQREGCTAQLLAAAIRLNKEEVAHWRQHAREEAVQQAMNIERTYIAWTMLLDGQPPEDIQRWTQIAPEVLERLEEL